MIHINKLFAALACLALLTSCGSDFLETEYTKSLDKETVSSLKQFDPFLLGAFSFMAKADVLDKREEAAHDDFSVMSVLHSADMMGEDIALSNFHWFGYDYDHDNHEFNYRRTLVDWTTFYTIVSKANEIIEQFEVEPIDVASKSALAHGYALRGYAYYYLIQLYQHPVKSDTTVNYDAPGIPLFYCQIDSLTDEVKVQRKGRNTLRLVYQQIEKDLTNAVRLFDGYIRPSKNYMDQSVAQGLLARYYLLSQQWQKAADAANAACTGYTLVSDLKDGFCDINNSEWMWGYDHTSLSQTSYASFFSHISNLSPGYAGPDYSARLIDKRLYDKISPSDIRKNWFNGPNGDPSQSMPGAQYPYANVKFGWVEGWTMDYMYMRAPEMYLIRAEALAHLGQGALAANALKPLMAVRDAAWNKTTVSVEDVYLQRRIELWGEGFSFFDLKRLNKGINRNYDGSNHLTGYKKVIPALAASWIYQLPDQEMQENKHLSEADQNE